MRLTFDGRVEQCVRWQREFTGAEIAFLNRELRSGLEAYQYPLPLHAGGLLSAFNHDMILSPQAKSNDAHATPLHYLAYQKLATCKPPVGTNLPCETGSPGACASCPKSAVTIG
jgi:hypothetical protein